MQLNIIFIYIFNIYISDLLQIALSTVKVKVKPRLTDSGCIRFNYVGIYLLYLCMFMYVCGVYTEYWECKV